MGKDCGTCKKGCAVYSKDAAYGNVVAGKGTKACIGLTRETDEELFVAVSVRGKLVEQL